MKEDTPAPYDEPPPDKEEDEFAFSDEYFPSIDEFAPDVEVAPQKEETKWERAWSGFNESFKENFFLIQRYLINTIFDSINTSIGIILGLYLSGSTAGYLFSMPLLSAAIALGISSGTSTFEAEYLEQLNKNKEIESHMFEGASSSSKNDAKKKAFLVGASNFLMPVGLSCCVTLFLLMINWIVVAVIVSIVFLISVLFITGMVFGKMNNISPIKRGVRMLAIGVLSFCVVFLLGYFT